MTLPKIRRHHVLILGGSIEGFTIASLLGEQQKMKITTSFAGRTKNRRKAAGLERVGGFGGAAGLAAYVKSENITAMIDATHPFAAQMKKNAAKAARRAGIPLVHVVRPPWRKRKTDQWHKVANMTQAARSLPQGSGPVFLAIGRSELPAFAQRDDVQFIARVIDEPEDDPQIAHLTLIRARGPFLFDEELALLQGFGVRHIVTKNSGGEAAYAKLLAAREMAIPVTMVARPRKPAGTIVTTPEEAAIWLTNMLDHDSDKVSG